MGCLVLSSSIQAYMGDSLCESNFVKMLTQQDVEGLEKFYFGKKSAIYKVIEEV